MSGMTEQSRLFEEFPPISREEWERRIQRDLGSADRVETLLWDTPDGYTMRPYYRADDLEDIPHMEGDASAEIRSDWTVLQTIASGDLDMAARHVREAAAGGVQAIGLRTCLDGDRMKGIPIQTAGDLRVILDEFPFDNVGLHLEAGLQTPALFAMLLSEVDRAGGTDVLAGSLDFDPLAELARTGRAAEGALDQTADLIKDVSADVPNVRLLRVGADVFHEAGATVGQEAGLLLASLSEYLAQLTDRSVAVSKIANRLSISVSVSTSYYHEIAKMRALRLLIPQVLRAFRALDGSTYVSAGGRDTSARHSAPDESIRAPVSDPESSARIPMHASTSRRSMTRFDAHTNLLRATTEAASAIIGGCDVVSVRPFDEITGGGGSFGLRLARNLQHVLRYEGRLDRVDDPAAGSYYLEVLTDVVARRAWKFFQEIETGGGLLASLQAGSVQRRLAASRAAIESDVAMAHRILVGTNRYPDPSEKLSASPATGIRARKTRPISSNEFSQVRRHVDDGGTLADLQWTTASFCHPVEPFREGELLEAARLDTQKITPAPSVLILPIGDPRTRTARAHFAANFLGCGGLEAEVPLGYDDTAAATAGLPRSCDILVVAAPDTLYRHEMLRELYQNIDWGIVGIVAQSNVPLEVDFRLHEGANVVETLRGIQMRVTTITAER